jgi:hypothetical protein
LILKFERKDGSKVASKERKGDEQFKIRKSSTIIVIRKKTKRSSFPLFVTGNREFSEADTTVVTG